MYDVIITIINYKKIACFFIFDKNGYVYKIELDNEVAENTNWFGKPVLRLLPPKLRVTPVNPKSC